MAAIVLKEETLKSLCGKVVVISGLETLIYPPLPRKGLVLIQSPGSAKGIGASTVSQLHAAGAKVIHGDWDEEASKHDTQLSTSSTSGGETQFVKTDVTNYDSVMNLFDTAWKKYARVDIAICNAGIQESGNWFDPSLDLESIKTVRPPPPSPPPRNSLRRRAEGIGNCRNHPPKHLT
jgi:hypothetical protein